MQLLDGVLVRNHILSSLREEVSQFSRPPGLSVIIVGNNPASEIYVRNKIRAAKKLGFHSELLQLPENATTHELTKVIQKLNIEPKCDGILVQMPLPAHMRCEDIILAIDPTKDVDGFHPVNCGKLCSNMPGALIPCTPLGITTLLRYYNIDLEGKKVAILGRSTIVGRPLSILLSQNMPYLNATVTLLHSKSQNIMDICQQSDMIVACMGKPSSVTEKFVRPGAIVIDVGINKVLDSTVEKGYKVAGDVAFCEVASNASWITPVPGGIGPMTIASLMQNTVQAYKQHENCQ